MSISSALVGLWPVRRRGGGGGGSGEWDDEDEGGCACDEGVEGERGGGEDDREAGRGRLFGEVGVFREGGVDVDVEGEGPGLEGDG